MGGGALSCAPLVFLSWTEGSGLANKKPYKETRSKLVVHNSSGDI